MVSAYWGITKSWGDFILSRYLIVLPSLCLHSGFASIDGVSTDIQRTWNGPIVKAERT